MLDFTEEIRNLTAEQFICDFLSKQMHVTQLLIGYDHRFGKNRAEGFEDYVRYGKSCGMDVVQEPIYDDGTNRNFSSSEVRRALIAGNIHEATEILGQFYRLEGVVIHGHQLGRKLGFPTANLNPFDKDKIIIADNGKGMTFDDLENKWLFLAKSALARGAVILRTVNLRSCTEKGTQINDLLSTSEYP